MHAKASRSTRETIDADQHFTEPPPRYPEATLVKKMEELGIGRPSTYASTLPVLRTATTSGSTRSALIPEDKGRLVTAFLESFFERYVEYDFTADLEEKLDEISDGELDWKEVLRDFWRDFTGAVDEIKDLRVTEVLDALNELLGAAHLPDARGRRRSARLPAPAAPASCRLKLGKFGAFVGCSQLSRMPLHAPARDAGDEGGRRPRRQACSARIPRPAWT